LLNCGASRAVAFCAPSRETQQQVFGGISAERKLGCDHQRRAAAPAGRHGVEQSPRSAREIAERLIQLHDRDLHETHGSTRARAPWRKFHCLRCVRMAFGTSA
jgi:hypothetical protein